MGLGPIHEQSLPQDWRWPAVSSPTSQKIPAGCKIGYSIMDTVTKKYRNGGFLDFNF